MTALRNFLIYLLAGSLLAAAGKAVRHPGSLTGGSTRHSYGVELTALPPPFVGVERLRLVLIGADDRKDRGRSDTLMYLEIRPATQRAVLLSIPRDLRVEIPGYGPNKINHAYHYGGPALTCRTVEGLLGVPVDGYIKINLEGFVKAVDILGGVYLEVEDVEGKGRGMNYDCPQDGLVIHLKPGYQHLDGYKAMGYVRYRLSNIPGKGSTDFDRAKRQQKFLRALIAQKLRVTNLPALYQAGQEIYRHVQTTLSWREALDLARFFQALPPGALKTLTLPVKDRRIRGVYYAVLDETAFAALWAEAEAFLQGATPIVEKAGPARVEVLNGSGVPGAAARTAERLKANGFVIVRVGNAPGPKQQQTRILYRGNERAAAERIARLLGVGIVAEEGGAGPAPPGTAQIQITLGLDATTKNKVK